MTSVGNTGTDYAGVVLNTNQNQNYNTFLYIMYGSFTGLHRCFTNDELYNNDNSQVFKDNYIGRIVIASGKIATDTKNNKDNKDNNEWNIKYNKEGITIEDALPIVQLSRKKKDKRELGVLGMSTRNNFRPEIMIIYSIGEGGIWVCNSDGNIENGDF